MTIRPIFPRRILRRVPWWLLRNNQGYLNFYPIIYITNLQTHKNHFKTRVVVLEVVKFGFWKRSYNIFCQWRRNGGGVKKRVNSSEAKSMSVARPRFEDQNIIIVIMCNNLSGSSKLTKCNFRPFIIVEQWRNHNSSYEIVIS